MPEKEKFFETERGKSVIKFGLWMVFIIVLVAIMAIKENETYHILDDTPENQDNVSTEPTDDKKTDNTTDLNDNNYGYTYKITSGDNIYVYHGVKCHGLDVGYKENGTDIIKYKVDYDQKVYSINLDNKNELENLYEDFDSKYLNTSFILNSIKTIEGTKNDTSTTYNFDGFSIEIYSNEESINKIKVITEETTYEMLFANVGKCDTITLD